MKDHGGRRHGGCSRRRVVVGVPRQASRRIREIMKLLSRNLPHIPRHIRLLLRNKFEAEIENLCTPSGLDISVSDYFSIKYFFARLL